MSPAGPGGERLTQRHLLAAPAARILLPLLRAALALALTGLVWSQPAARWLSLLWLAAAFFLRRQPARAWDLARLGIDTLVLVLSLFLNPPPGFWLLIPAMTAFLVAQTSLLHGWPETLAVSALVAVAVFLERQAAGGWAWTIPPLMGAIGLAAQWRSRKLEQRMEKLSARLVMHRAEAISARASERERISSDFHDGPLQSFAGLQLGLEAVHRRLECDPEAGMRDLEELKNVWSAQVIALREFVRTVRIGKGPAGDIAQAMRSLVEAFQKDTGIRSTFESGVTWRGDADRGSHLLLILQEALSNVRKHARATQVRVNLSESGGVLRLTIGDNGAGFPFQGTYQLEALEDQHLGPASIQRRVRLLGGELEIESAAGATVLRIRAPL